MSRHRVKADARYIPRHFAQALRCPRFPGTGNAAKCVFSSQQSRRTDAATQVALSLCGTSRMPPHVLAREFLNSESSHEIPTQTDLLPSMAPERPVAQADGKSLREQLWRRIAAAECNYRAARIARLRHRARTRREWAQARAAHRAQFDALARAFFREPGRGRETDEADDRSAHEGLRIGRPLAAGVHRHGESAERRFRMG